MLEGKFAPPRVRVLVIDDELTQDTAEGRAARGLVSGLEVRNLDVVQAISAADGMTVVTSDAAIHCVLMDWTLGDDDEKTHEKAKALLTHIRGRKTMAYFRKIVTDTVKMREERLKRDPDTAPPRDTANGPPGAGPCGILGQRAGDRAGPGGRECQLRPVRTLALLAALLTALVAVLLTAPAMRMVLAINSRVLNAPLNPCPPMSIRPPLVVRITLRCVVPSPGSNALKDTRPVESARLPVLKKLPPSTVMPLGLARMK
jgi:hypothetical protein